MILFSLGIPGAFSDWCDALAHRIASETHAGVTPVSVDSLAELGLAQIRTASPHFIGISRTPGQDLRLAQLDHRSRIVLALDDPRHALADLVHKHGFPLLGAVRAIANSCASLVRYLDYPDLLVLRPEKARDAPREVAAAMCKHYDLGLPQPLSVEPAPFETGQRIDECESWWASLDEPDRILADGAIGAYSQCFATGNLDRIAWDRRLFFSGDTPSESPPASIDITGRGRCLIYGPYIRIPPGTWTARIELGCTDEAAGTQFVVDAAAGHRLGHVTFSPKFGGVFETALPFTLEEDNPHLLEIRFFVERSSFEGRLALGAVTLLPTLRPQAIDRHGLRVPLGLTGTRQSSRT